MCEEFRIVERMEVSKVNVNRKVGGVHQRMTGNLLVYYKVYIFLTKASTHKTL